MLTKFQIFCSKYAKILPPNVIFTGTISSVFFAVSLSECFILIDLDEI